MRLLGPTLLLTNSLAGPVFAQEQGMDTGIAAPLLPELTVTEPTHTPPTLPVPTTPADELSLGVCEDAYATVTPQTPPVTDSPPLISSKDCFVMQGHEAKSYLFCGPLANGTATPDNASEPASVDLTRLISGESKGEDVGKVFAGLDWKKGIASLITIIGGIIGFIYSGRKITQFKTSIDKLATEQPNDKKTEQERQKQLFQNNAMRLLSLGARLFSLPMTAIVATGIVFGASSLITFGVGILALSMNAFIVIAKEPLNNLFYSGFLKLNQSKLEQGEEIEVEGMRFIYQGVDGQHVYGHGIDDVGDAVMYIVPSSLVFNRPGKNFKKLSPLVLSIEPHKHYASLTLKDGASIYGKVVGKTDMILVVESLNDKGHKLRRFIRLNDVNDNTFQLFDGPQPLEFFLHGKTVHINIGDKIIQLGTTPEIKGTLVDFNDDILALENDGDIIILPRTILMRGIRLVRGKPPAPAPETMAGLA